MRLVLAQALQERDFKLLMLQIRTLMTPLMSITYINNMLGLCIEKVYLTIIKLVLIYTSTVKPKQK